VATDFAFTVAELPRRLRDLPEPQRSAARAAYNAALLTRSQRRAEEFALQQVAMTRRL
jgi:hypothetical protein